MKKGLKKASAGAARPVNPSNPMRAAKETKGHCDGSFSGAGANVVEGKAKTFAGRAQYRGRHKS